MYISCTDSNCTVRRKAKGERRKVIPLFSSCQLVPLTDRSRHLPSTRQHLFQIPQALMDTDVSSSRLLTLHYHFTRTLPHPTHRTPTLIILHAALRESSCHALRSSVRILAEADRASLLAPWLDHSFHANAVITPLIRPRPLPPKYYIPLHE
jgi:hypothetical protein